jgi:hypothetical protein
VGGDKRTCKLSGRLVAEVVLLVHALEKRKLRGFQGLLVDYRSNASLEVNSRIMREQPWQKLARLKTLA